MLECAVAHCADKHLQKKFFGKPALTLHEALDIATLEEQIRAQLDCLNSANSSVTTC